MEKLTVVTPAYNRAKELKTSYKALCNQTCKDFIWMIIDDGSEDSTEEVVKSWIKENNIDIVYIKQKNGGKYRAINTAIRNCTTEWFGFLDSDDYYLNSTVEKIYYYIDKIEKDDKIAGIIARRQKEDEKIVGSNIELKEGKINFNKLVQKYDFYGDTCRIYRHDILLKCMYPEEYPDKFIPESVMLSKIDKDYDIYFVNEGFSVSEYLDNGYTSNYKKLLLNNVNGYFLALKVQIESELRFTKKLRNTVVYICWGIHKNLDYKSNIHNKLLLYMCLPIAKMLILLKIPKWWYYD